MIVPMRKVFVVARRDDRQRLLAVLREAGLLHLIPADPAQAVADEHAVRQIQALRTALQDLYGIAPHGEPPAVSASEAAQEVLAIQQRSVEHGNRLATLHHQLEQLEPWGDLRLTQLDELRAAGVEVRFFAVPQPAVAELRGDCVHVLGELPDDRLLVAVAHRGSPPPPPADAQPLHPPHRDAASLRGEAAEIEAAVKQDHQRLAQLAQRSGELQAELERLEKQAAFTVALRGGLEREALFAVQGWLPSARSAALTDALADSGLPVALQFLEAAGDEQPPTLIRTPAWARPIEGLFQILGTVAGYREFDIAVPFLIALPIFTALLISDGGYGAVLVLALTLGYRRAARLLGAPFTQLLLIIAAAALVWGAVCATFFGVTLYPPLIPVDLSAESRTLLMRICFWMGAIHLSLAQLWPALRLFPDLRFLNRVGWAVFIWGMLGVVQMFVLKTPLGWHTPWPYFLAAGAALAILFAHPSRNLGKMLLWGCAGFPLSMLSAFSDVISYVRLMAVGLASSVLGASFNTMAAGLDSWALAGLVLVFGHSLNLGLAMIAMFAHGVRLNMLEFCNNLGMQWTGYRYSPFSHRTTQEY